jgi:hypothetical protein
VQVLWWLVPPLVATFVAMLWAAWAGRARDDVRRDDSEEALERMRKALAKSAPARPLGTQPPPLERGHGVVLRAGPRTAPSAAQRRVKPAVPRPR